MAGSDATIRMVSDCACVPCWHESNGLELPSLALVPSTTIFAAKRTNRFLVRMVSRKAELQQAVATTLPQ